MRNSTVTCHPAFRSQLIVPRLPPLAKAQTSSIRMPIDGPMDMFAQILDFDAEAWKTIVEHGGDFSSAGFDLKKDDPVAGCDQHWWKE